MKRYILVIGMGIMVASSIAIADPAAKGTGYLCGNLPRSSSAEPDFAVTATLDSESNKGSIQAFVNGEQISEAAQVDFVFHSTMGLSRCPGTWTEIQFTPITESSPFKKLFVMKSKHFFGCGSAPMDSVVLKINDKNEEISALCRQF